jgi:S1-C subfamily serine protease
VIGMDTAATGGGRFQSAAGVAFAIPINAAMAVVHQIEARRASAAVHIGDAAFLGVEIAAGGSGGSAPTSPGAVIASVEPNTPAQSLGLAAGDTVVSVDGKAVDTPSDLTSQISNLHPGDLAKIGWLDKSGKAHSGTVRLTVGPTK